MEAKLFHSNQSPSLLKIQLLLFSLSSSKEGELLQEKKKESKDGESN